MKERDGDLLVGETLNDVLKRLLSRVFEMDESQITSDLTPESVVMWDSLHHLKMVTEIESVFDIRLTMKEIRGMTNFGKIQDVVKSHLDGGMVTNDREEPK